MQVNGLRLELEHTAAASAHDEEPVASTDTSRDNVRCKNNFCIVVSANRPVSDLGSADNGKKRSPFGRLLEVLQIADLHQQFGDAVNTIRLQMVSQVDVPPINTEADGESNFEQSDLHCQVVELWELVASQYQTYFLGLVICHSG